MADNTQLNTGSGGDLIRSEDVGGGVKVPVSKLHTGAAGADGGPVTEDNPLPVLVQLAMSALRPLKVVSDILAMAQDAVGGRIRTLTDLNGGTVTTVTTVTTTTTVTSLTNMNGQSTQTTLLYSNELAAWALLVRSRIE